MATDLELGSVVRSDGMSFEDIGSDLSQQSSNLSSPSSHVVEVSAEAKLETNYFEVCVPLMNAASNDDWNTAAKIIHPRGKAVLLVSITEQGETVLHLAAKGGHVRFMSELLKLLDKVDLESKDGKGNTALMLAAVVGNVQVAKIMVLQHPILSEMRDEKGMTALHFAASQGHGEMASYLYPITKCILSREDRVGIFFSCINTDLYELAMEMLRDQPELAVARDSEMQTALHLLAGKPLIFAIKRSSGRWKSCVSSCIYFERNRTSHHGSTFLSFLLETQKEYIQKQDDPQMIKDILASPSPVLHLAAEAGNLEFSATLIKCYPESVNQKNESNQNFLHIAAKHHQLGMFSLVEKCSCRSLIYSNDDDNNNILHFAAMLPPPNGLDAMLQMKRDQKWFKNFQEVMKLVPAGQYLKMKNSEGKTPVDILREAHNEGLSPSKKAWLKNVAHMSTIVSTFIAIGVAFSWFPSHGSEYRC